MTKDSQKTEGSSMGIRGGRSKKPMNQDILARQDLLQLGYNLLKYRGYSHEVAQELALDALYSCARHYKDSMGATLQTYYNKRLLWACGKLSAENKRKKNQHESFASFKVLENIGDPHKDFEHTRGGIEVSELLKLLPKRSAKIMRLIYVDGYTMVEVSKIEKVTRQRIGQIVLKSKKLLKKLIKEKR